MRSSTSVHTKGAEKERILYRVPGEIKRSRDLREVELDPQLCPEEIMSREVALD